jgi:fructose-bisphosphate aldolase class II
MLANMKDLTSDAERGGYCVGAFNLVSMEAVKAAIRAAEDAESPIILQLAEVQAKGAPMELMFPMMIGAAKNARVPVAVHFDHGLTFENILKAIKYGCTSVMFDGAALPFEENIAKTKEIVRIARAMGVGCEAEIGIVGGAEAGGNNDADEKLTDPAQAAEFAERTGCDFLAVAIGNAHGPYQKEPNIRFDRLEQINGVVDVPLVLHGGSGISAEDFRRCIVGGVRKINVATALIQNTMRRVEGLYAGTEKPGYNNLMKQIEEGAYEEILRHIKIFMSDGKAGKM